MAEEREALAKKLGLLDVYAIATGATLSAGFFLLPGLAAIEAGPALVAAYVLAAVPLVPGILSKVELMTALPRAGGIYFFLDRSLGPAAGTVGGIGIWLVLILKVSFALVGAGAYLEIFFPALPIVPVAVGLAVFMGMVNVTGAKLTGGLQIALVVGILAGVGTFMAAGVGHVDPTHFRDFFASGYDALFATTGMVFVSYAGLTKIAAIAEEVEDPERNLRRGVFLALATALVVYGLGTAVIVGVLPMEELRGDLTSVATAGGVIFGEWGVYALAAVALLAFMAVTNAGTLGASRYPLAMSRDGIFPEGLEELNERGVPARSIALTVGVMVAVIVLLDPMKIAKLASAFKLLVFALLCLSVVVMRESGIEEYDPGYVTPFYPWTQVLGIVAPIALIFTMGWLSILFSTGLVVLGVVWYWRFARKEVAREGAIYHLFERLGRRRHEPLEAEFRQILKEKGLREEDPYSQMIGAATVVDLDAARDYEEVVRTVSETLADRLPGSEERLARTFLEEISLGVTPVSHGVALPHARLEGIRRPHLLMVRIRGGVEVRPEHRDEATGGGTIHAVFFLVSPEDDPRQHLRMLAKLADHAEQEDFLERWLEAGDEQHLKDVLLKGDRAVSLRVSPDRATRVLMDRTLEEVGLTGIGLVCLLRREGKVVDPEPDTALREGDRLTLLGHPEAVAELRKRFGRR